jgi:hypothetical protein
MGCDEGDDTNAECDAMNGGRAVISLCRVVKRGKWIRIKDQHENP